MNRDSPRASGGYPLIALFLLLTACGIVAALLGPAVRAVAAGKVAVSDAFYASVVGSIAVMIIGGCVGVFHYRRLRGLGWGLLTGAAIGMLAGPLVLAPRETLGSVIAFSFGGAAVILLVSAAFRVASAE